MQTPVPEKLLESLGLARTTRNRIKPCLKLALPLTFAVLWICTCVSLFQLV